MKQLKDLTAGDMFAGHRILSNNKNQDSYTLTVSGTVESLNEDCFDLLESMSYFKIPSEVTSIGNNTFTNCDNLQTLDMSDMHVNIVDELNINKIGSNSDTTIILPLGVDEKKLQYSPVSNLSESDLLKLEEIFDGVREDSPEVELNNNEILYVASDNMPLTIDETLVLSHENNKIVLKSSVVPDDLFYNQNRLVHVYLSNGITHIGKNAFRGCSNLDYVYIPDSVVSFDTYSFYGCTKMLLVRTSNQITEIPNSCFENCENLTYFNMPTGLVRIRERAFAGCLNIGGGFESVRYTTEGEWNTSSENSLRLHRTSLVMPDTLLYIDDFAFSHASVDVVDFGNTRTTVPTFGLHWCQYEKNGKWLKYSKNRVILVHVLGEVELDLENTIFVGAIVVPDQSYDLWLDLPNIGTVSQDIVYYGLTPSGGKNVATPTDDGKYLIFDPRLQHLFVIEQDSVWTVTTKYIRKWSERYDEHGQYCGYGSIAHSLKSGVLPD